MIAPASEPNDVGDRDRGGARLRHRPSRHDARLPSAFRPPAQAPPARPRPRRRLRRGRARHRRRQSPQAQGLARRHRSRRGRGRQRQRQAQRRRRLMPGGRLARGRERALCARARLTTSCSPTSWRSPCACWRRRSRAVIDRRGRGDRLRPASCRCRRACLRPGGRRGFIWPSGSTSKAGRASGCGGEIAARPPRRERLVARLSRPAVKLAGLNRKGGERHGEDAGRGRPQAAADRGPVRRDRRSRPQEASARPLSSRAPPGFIPKCRIIGVSLDAIDAEGFRAHRPRSGVQAATTAGQTRRRGRRFAATLDYVPIVGRRRRAQGGGREGASRPSTRRAGSSTI